MIALYILAGLLFLIALILLLPVSVCLKYDGDFAFKVKFAGIKIFEPKDKPKKSKTEAKPAKEAKENQFKTTFDRLKDKKGFIGAIKEIFAFLKDCLTHLGFFIKTMRFKKVYLDLNVVGSDAATTAIQYGQVCSVAYPTLSFFQSKATVKYNKIYIKSNIEGKTSSFSFSAAVNLQIIFLIISGFRINKEYKKFSIRNEL